MIALDRFRCPCCKLLYGFQNTPKILKNCNHSICISCLKTQNKCPIDLKEINLSKYGFRSFLTNIEILEEIQVGGKTYSIKGEKEKQYLNQNQNQTKLHKQKSGFHNICQNHQSNHSESVRQQKGNLSLCLIHCQKAVYICEKDKTCLCNVCLLQGDHRYHNYISHEQLLKNLMKLADDSFVLQQKIDTKYQNLLRRNIEEKIRLEINNKKQSQILKTRLFYQKVIQKLRNLSQKNIQQLHRKSTESINRLIQCIDLDQIERNRALWNKQIHQLTKVIEKLYNHTDFKDAFRFYDLNKQKQSVVENGQSILNSVNEKIISLNNLISEQTKILEGKFPHGIDDDFVQKITSFNDQINFGRSTENQHYSKKKGFQIHKLFSLGFDLKNNRQSFSSDRFSDQINLHEEDFLLDNTQSMTKNESITKNQITFEENFSLINGYDQNRQQFTPILKKQQDSIANLEQSTVINPIIVSKRNNNFQKAQFEAINMGMRQISENLEKTRLITLQLGHKENSQFKSEFSKTLTERLPLRFYEKSHRSPLKSMRNESNSKLKKIELPEKYRRMWEYAKSDGAQVIDFTGAQLGDSMIMNLACLVSNSKKIKSLKLIRNKLTDQIIPDLIQTLRTSNICSLNLSQNFLTEKSLEIIESMDLGNIKNITLSLNKIILRKVRDKVERFKSNGITLSI